MGWSDNATTNLRNLMKKKLIQFQLKDKEIAAFEKEFKKSGFRSRSEFLRAVYFYYVKATSEA